MNKGELLHWKEIIERWGGTTDCMPIQQTLLGIIDALLQEPKPVATETGMDKRTRMKKLILEMLEIV